MSCARRIHLCVLIDALGWRLLEGQDFLFDLLPYRIPLRTVLGFSSGAIPTILTGRLPAENGHWNLLYYDPEGSPFRWLRHFGFLPAWALEHRVTRKLLKEMGRRVLRLGPLFECAVSPRLLPWFNWVEKRNIYDRGGIAGSASIFDQLAESGIPYRVYSYHQWTDKEIFARAKSDLQRAELTFFFLYLSELDQFLHDHCRDGSLLKERLDWYARKLRDLFQLARELDPHASLTIFSDHGMTPVRHHYDLVEEVEELGFVMPRDYLAVYDSTMGRFWFFSDQVRCRVVKRLKSLPCGRIVSDEELKQLGIFFSDRRYGELIFLLHPGWLMTRSNFNGHQWVPTGMHGYHPEDPYSDAVFLCDREPATNMRTIANVHDHIQEIVEIDR
jgi:type I phosphodiesterase/nucleotide pyrophosphatase